MSHALNSAGIDARSGVGSVVGREGPQGWGARRRLFAVLRAAYRVVGMGCQRAVGRLGGAAAVEMLAGFSGRPACLAGASIAALVAAGVAGLALTVTPTPAAAFMCTDASPPSQTGTQNDGGSANNTACGTNANAGGANSFNTATGYSSNSSGAGSSNTASGSLTNASGANSFNNASGRQADADGDNSFNTATGYSSNASGAGSSNTASGLH